MQIYIYTYIHISIYIQNSTYKNTYTGIRDRSVYVSKLGNSGGDSYFADSMHKKTKSKCTHVCSATIQYMYTE